MDAKEIVSIALDLVGGDRANTHGDKTKNHDNIAEMWNGYLRIRKDPVAPLTAADVAIMMVLLKVARTQLGAFNPDDAVDACGDSAVFGEIAYLYAAKNENESA